LRWGFGNTTDQPSTESVAEGSTFEWGADNTITLTYRIDGTSLNVDVTYLEAESGTLKTYTSTTCILDDDLTSLTQLVGFSSTTGAYDCVGNMTIGDFAVPEPAEWAAIFSLSALAFAVWHSRK